jgi:hypothetical protein
VVKSNRVGVVFVKSVCKFVFRDICILKCTVLSNTPRQINSKVYTKGSLNTHVLSDIVRKIFNQENFSRDNVCLVQEIKCAKTVDITSETNKTLILRRKFLFMM